MMYMFNSASDTMWRSIIIVAQLHALVGYRNSLDLYQGRYLMISLKGETSALCNWPSSGPS